MRLFLRWRAISDKKVDLTVTKSANESTHWIIAAIEDTERTALHPIICSCAFTSWLIHYDNNIKRVWLGNTSHEESAKNCPIHADHSSKNWTSGRGQGRGEGGGGGWKTISGSNPSPKNVATNFHLSSLSGWNCAKISETFLRLL